MKTPDFDDLIELKEKDGDSSLDLTASTPIEELRLALLTLDTYRVASKVLRLHALSKYQVEAIISFEQPDEIPVLAFYATLEVNFWEHSTELPIPTAIAENQRLVTTGRVITVEYVPQKNGIPTAEIIRALAIAISKDPCPRVKLMYRGIAAVRRAFRYPIGHATTILAEALIPNPPEVPLIQILEVAVPNERDVFSKIPEAVKTDLKNIGEFSLELLYHPGLQPMVSWLQKKAPSVECATNTFPSLPKIAMIRVNEHKLKRSIRKQDIESKTPDKGLEKKYKRLRSNQSDKEEREEAVCHSESDASYEKEKEITNKDHAKISCSENQHTMSKRDDTADTALVAQFVTDQVIKACFSDQHIKVIRDFASLEKDEELPNKSEEETKTLVLSETGSEASSSLAFDPTATEAHKSGTDEKKKNEDSREATLLDPEVDSSKKELVNLSTPSEI